MNQHTRQGPTCAAKMALPMFLELRGLRILPPKLLLHGTLR